MIQIIGKVMKVLAFDTSSTSLSVALLEDDVVQAEQLLTTKKNHSISLMPVVDFLMQQVGWSPKALNRIVVAQGPGSYTGLRVAVATAKTLAYSLNIELVGQSSLYALTGNVPSGLVVPLIDARRNNVYAGFYENGKSVRPDCHMSFSEVLEIAAVFSQVTFVGEVDAFISQVEETLPTATVMRTYPSAVLLAQSSRDKQPVEVHSFVPRYLKKVEAEENWLKLNAETGDNYIKRV